MRIELPSGTSAEIARPDGPPQGGLVVAPDIWGLRPLFDDLVARLAAEQQWVVVAPEPFPGPDLGDDIDRRFEAVAKLEDHRVLGDLVAAAELTGADRVGLIGFCLGGMYSLKAASLGRFSRVVAFYGMIRVPLAWRSAGQGEPLDLLAGAPASSSPLMAVIGELDPYTPPEDVAALEAAGVPTARYPKADHAFVHDPARPSHRPDDAADAWRRALTFLRS